MMSEEYYTANLKKLNIEKREVIGGLDLPEGRKLKEEDFKPQTESYKQI